eukprot:TRINITY_DN79950_c0_g1_i1.p1 TRINITY_DN79950_c0_g1~~TRINITY_DN79950_c0_g1_i1.p1  ORF type:complete len:940 (-),score=73.81 TRINITY_DN79950_c0_g1_i1:254-3073(-)
MVPRPLDCSQSPPELGGAIPADRAFAFLSKSFLDVRRSAETDLKLISARTQSLKKIAEQLDDWENIKLPAVFPLSASKDKEVTAGTLIRQIKDRSRELTRPLSVDSELDLLFKNWEQHVPPALSKLKKLKDAGGNGRSPISMKPFDGRQFINLDEWNKAVKAHKWLVGDNWAAPLQRAVKEGLKEFEAAASASGSPAPGAPEFLKLVKQNLKLPGADKFVSEKRDDVPPLDVPELIESLARSSEMLLDHLGMDKAVASKLRSTIRALRNSGASTPDVDTRVAQIMQSTGYRLHEDDAGWWAPIALTGTSSSSKRTAKKSDPKKRRFAIVTTASLPWMTGTAVNPLLRAAYLAALGRGVEVTLLVPWLGKEDQQHVYPRNMTFGTPSEQEAYMRDWLRERVGFNPDMKIAFYPGRFSTEKRSILAVGDISSFIPDSEADVAVLEEPEHLTWYYHGRRWTDKFQHVVGIIHTNYLEYVRREKNGPMQAFLLEHVNNWMVRCYCNNVVRLSAATQQFPRSTVCNVHGVGNKFLDVGARMAEAMTNSSSSGNGSGASSPFSAGAYYLGKMVWGKGYRELVDLLAGNREALGPLQVDVYGSGEDSEDVRREATAKGLTMAFHPGRDHADSSLHKYKVFINPSVSDVVCTTTAEALAMGKIVVCADHPSNDFFRNFPNCYIYRNEKEFVQSVRDAMASQPQPLSAEHRHMLSWEAATERFLRTSGIASELSHLLPAPDAPVDSSASLADLTCSSPTSSAHGSAVDATQLAKRSQSSGDLTAAAPIDNSSSSGSGRRGKAGGKAGKGKAVFTELSELASPRSSPVYTGGLLHSMSAQDLSLATPAVPSALAYGSEAGSSQLGGDHSHSNGQSGMLLPSASLSLSLSAPDLTEVTDRFLSFAHFMASGVEAARVVSGAAPDSMHITEEFSKDLGLPPVWAQRPSYGW